MSLLLLDKHETLIYWLNFLQRIVETEMVFYSILYSAF